MNRSTFQLILITVEISFGLGVCSIYLKLLQNISERIIHYYIASLCSCLLSAKCSPGNN